MRAFAIPESGLTQAQVAAVAAGYAQGVEQDILRADGQLGRTVLAVGNTTDGRAQCTSLGAGNVAFTYRTGADFAAGNPMGDPIFLRLGEIYIFEGLQNGSIITFSEGGHGCSGQRTGNNESPMPLLSLGLGFTDTFAFAFRNSNANEGRIHVVNGPVASSITLFDVNLSIVLNQQDIELDPWEARTLQTDGNGEYRLISTNRIMACIQANMDSNGYYDSRPIFPLTNDGLVHPRSGNMSAPYNNTRVRWYVRDGAAWNQGSGQALNVSPGSPVDIDAPPPAGTGANDQDYEPNGATRFLADGLISAYSGADSAGLEATPMIPTAACVQRVALPLFIRDGGDGGNNGISIVSPYEGTARIYEWDPVGESAVLVYTVPITRGVTVTTPEDQLHPAAALVSNDAQATVTLAGDFYGGYVEADVPIHVVFNSEQNQNGATTITRLGTSGPSVVAINADDDEQISTGITPDDIRAEIRRSDADGLLYIRQIGAGGVDSWRLA